MDMVASCSSFACVDVAQVGRSFVVCSGWYCVVHLVGRPNFILTLEAMGGTIATNPQSRNCRFDTHRSWLSWRTLWLCFVACGQCLCLCGVHIVGHSQSLLYACYRILGRSDCLFASLSRSALCWRRCLWGGFRRFCCTISL